MAEDEAETTTALTDFIPVLESIMRISLAGFGGAMAGLSLSRRGAAALSSRAVSSTVTKTTHTIHRHHPTVSSRSSSLLVNPHAADRELPAAWAMACMAFTGVVEFTRFVSPSRVALDYYYSLKNETVSTSNDDSIILVNSGGGGGGGGGDNQQLESVKPIIEDVTNNGQLPDMMSQLSQYCSHLFSELPVASSSSFFTTTNIKLESIQTIVDYTLGGSLGGALFTGSAIRTRSGKKFDAALLGSSSSSMMKGGALKGLLPGAALGLFAGLVIVTVDSVTEYLEEEFGREDDGIMIDEESMENDKGLEKEKNDDAEIVVPAHVKAMTNEELAKAIEDLKR